MITEGRWWQEQLLAHSVHLRTEQRAKLLNSAAMLATVQGDTSRAIELHEETLRLCEELQLREPHTRALIALGTIYARQGDFPSAIAHLESALALARALGRPDPLSTACYMLAGILVDEGREIDRALTLYDECLEIARQNRIVVTESMTLAVMGVIHALTGNTTRAAALLPEALRLQREMNVTMAIGWTHQYLGILAYQQAEYTARCAAFYRESGGCTTRRGAIHRSTVIRGYRRSGEYAAPGNVSGATSGCG